MARVNILRLTINVDHTRPKTTTPMTIPDLSSKASGGTAGEACPEDAMCPRCSGARAKWQKQRAWQNLGWWIAKVLVPSTKTPGKG